MSNGSGLVAIGAIGLAVYYAYRDRLERRPPGDGGDGDGDTQPAQFAPETIGDPTIQAIGE